MGFGRKYTAEDKANALAAYIANGGSLRRASETTGVPRKTLASWIERSDRSKPAQPQTVTVAEAPPPAITQTAQQPTPRPLTCPIPEDPNHVAAVSSLRPELPMGPPQPFPTPEQIALASVTLGTKMENIANQLADEIPNKIAAAPLNQLAVAMGIAIDKMRLLREQSTANVSSAIHLQLDELRRLPPDELTRLYHATLAE